MAAIPRRMAEPSYIYFTTDLPRSASYSPRPSPARSRHVRRKIQSAGDDEHDAGSCSTASSQRSYRSRFIPAPSHAVPVRLSSWITLCSRRDRGTDTIITTFRRPMHPTCHRVMGISILRSRNAMRAQLQKPEVRSSCVNFARSQ